MKGAGLREFPRAAVGWIAGIGAVSFLLAILLAAFAEDLGSPVSHGPDSYSRSALGHRAFAELLERNGVTVIHGRSERGVALGKSAAFLAEEPPPGFARRKEAVENLRRRIRRSVGSGAVLVLVPPKWEGFGDPARPEWILDSRPLGASEVQEVLDALLPRSRTEIRFRAGGEPKRMRCEDSWGGTRWVQLASPRLLEKSAGLEPIVTCGDGLLAARLPRQAFGGDAIIVSDPDLLNNQGLGRAQNASVAAGLFLGGLGVSKVLFDETIHGYTLGSGVLQELLRFPLILAVAHGLLVAALLVWSGMGRFGKVEAPPPALGSGKEVLVRNAAQLMQMAGTTGHLLPSYLDGTIRSVAAHHFLPADSPRGPLLRRLGEIAKSRRVSIDLTALRRQSDRLGRSPRVADARALDLAQRIHEWKKEMTDVH